MTAFPLLAGALLAAAAVAAGAFGAHGLADKLDARGLELWETGSRYLMYAALALLALGAAAAGAGLPRRPVQLAALGLLLGGLIFSGTLGAMALGAPRWLGAVTPLGGLLLIAGFLCFAWAVIAAGS